MRAVKSLWALALLSTLGACGAAMVDTPNNPGLPLPPVTGGGTATANYTALYNETQALRSRYPAGSGVSTATQLPNSGRAVYQGTAVIRVPTADNLSLLGDATVLANFTDDRISGSLGNFNSVQGTANRATAWDGTISLSSNANQGINVSRPNYIRADTVGTLYQGGNVLSVNGVVDGNFQNYGRANATGLSASMQNGGNIRYNGTNYTVGGPLVSGDGTRAGMTIMAEDRSAVR